MNVSGNPGVDRLVNLIAALSLAVVDEITGAIRPVAGGGREPAALVTLATWPDLSVEGLRTVLGLSQPATVHLVDRLARDGLVERHAGPDRRTRALRLTGTGQAAAEQVRAARLDAVARVLHTLPAGERARLTETVSALLSGVDRDRDQAMRLCRLCDQELCKAAAACPVDESACRR